MQAGIYADVIGSRQLDDPETLLPALERGSARAEQDLPPVSSRLHRGRRRRAAGALADAVQAPLCVSVLRELLAPLQVRVGVAVEGPAEDAFVAAWHEDRLVTTAAPAWPATCC